MNAISFSHIFLCLETDPYTDVTLYKRTRISMDLNCYIFSRPTYTSIYYITIILCLANTTEYQADCSCNGITMNMFEANSNQHILSPMALVFY